jgi:hypothetical protein
MKIRPTVLPSLLALAIAVLAYGMAAHAQNVPSRVLKNGESVDLTTVYYIVNCRSILTAVPAGEILEGPPQLSLTVTEAMVLPRREQCASEVKGAKLTLTAKDVTERTEGKVTIRLKYQTKNGERQGVRQYNVTLMP